MSTESWPSLKVSVEFCAWHWRFRWWRDDLTPTFMVQLGPLMIEWWSA